MRPVCSRRPSGSFRTAEIEAEGTPMRYTFAVVAISILVTIGLPVASMGGPLAFETIDVPNAGPTVPNDINSRGQIVGLFVASGTHGFLLSKGQFATFDVIPGASDTQACCRPQGSPASRAQAL